MIPDALLVVSYGGPRGPEDVLPFMRNATRGRGIPDERLVAVSGHYARFGGVSPINARNDELVAALRAELSRRGVEIPIAVGNRNWTPYLADALAELAAGGARHVRCLPTSAYASYSGCRQYRENLAGAPVELSLVGPYAESDGFVAANADALIAALRSQPAPRQTRVLFVTHSIPVAMDAASGPGGPEGRYVAQHRRVAARVAERAASALGFVPEWELVYCSRSGAPGVPWLEPDINDHLECLAAAGVSAVVAAPLGFVHDHMEVVYDLDTEAAATASALGIGYVRAATAGVHPAFVAMLADRALAEESRRCPSGCCGSGRPGAPPRPAACEDPQREDQR